MWYARAPGHRYRHRHREAGEHAGNECQPSRDSHFAPPRSKVTTSAPAGVERSWNRRPPASLKRPRAADSAHSTASIGERACETRGREHERDELRPLTRPHPEHDEQAVAVGLRELDLAEVRAARDPPRSQHAIALHEREERLRAARLNDDFGAARSWESRACGGGLLAWLEQLTGAADRQPHLSRVGVEKRSGRTCSEHVGTRAGDARHGEPSARRCVAAHDRLRRLVEDVRRAVGAKREVTLAARKRDRNVAWRCTRPVRRQPIVHLVEHDHGAVRARRRTPTGRCAPSRVP